MTASSRATLLVSLGKQGRDYLALLAEISAAEIDAFAEINSDSLLHLVQQDLLELQDGTRIKPKRHITAEDRSLVLHGCHSRCGKWKYCTINCCNVLALTQTFRHRKTSW